MKSTLPILLICSFANTVLAKTSQHDSLLTGGNEVLSNSFRVIWGLLIVLGIILILYGLLRKRFSLLSSSTDKEIQIREIKPLMGKKALCLVEVRGQEFLIGISDSTISTLANLTAKKEQSFADALKKESGAHHE